MKESGAVMIAVAGMWRRLSIMGGFLIMLPFLQSAEASAVDCDSSAEVRVSAPTTFSSSAGATETVEAMLDVVHHNSFPDFSCATGETTFTVSLSVDGNVAASCNVRFWSKSIDAGNRDYDTYFCFLDWTVPENRESVTLSVVAQGSLGLSSSETLTVTARKAQSITFNQTPSGRVGEVIDLSASGGQSGKPVTFNSTTPETCRTSGTNGARLTLNAAKTCTIVARQEGSAGYDAAPDVTRSFDVRKGQQPVTGLWPTRSTRVGLDLPLFGVMAGSRTARLSIEQGGDAFCEIKDDIMLHAKAAGECVVKATVDEDTNYEAAEARMTVSVSKGTQPAPILTVPSPVVFGQAVTLSITRGAGSGPVRYVVQSGTEACSIEGNQLTGRAAGGQCLVRAEKEGDANYESAVSNSVLVQVLKASQPPFSLTIPSLVVGQQIGLAASGGAEGGTITYSVASASSAFCELVGSAGLKGKATGGSCSVTAVKRVSGGNFEDASAIASVVVGMGVQTALAVEASGTLAFPGTVSLTSTGGTGTGAVTYQVVSGPCSVTGNQLSSTGLGTCRVTATKASDGNYESVTSAPLDVVVGESLAANGAEEAVRDSMADTAQSTLGYQPHADRLDSRNGSGGSGTAFLPQGTSTNGMIAFSASAGQIIQAAGKGDMQVVPTSAQRRDQGYDPYLKTPGSVDIWIDGRFIWRNGADRAGGLDQRAFLGETGVDYLVTENLLIGLSVRLDTNDAKLGGAGGDLDTVGWLAGPYVVWEITPGLQADAKLAYGQSSNDISVIISGSRFDGSYDSTRWMAEGGLRGRLELSSILIEPGLRAAYYRETAESYTLSGGGGVVKEQELSLMRLSFDPRLTYLHMTDEGTSISPFLSPQIAAEWKETKSGDEGWDVYGAVEGGLSIATEDFSVSTTLSASGFGGEGAVSYSAGANLTIPLN